MGYGGKLMKKNCLNCKFNTCYTIALGNYTHPICAKGYWVILSVHGVATYLGDSKNWCFDKMPENTVCC